MVGHGAPLGEAYLLLEAQFGDLESRPNQPARGTWSGSWSRLGPTAGEQLDGGSVMRVQERVPEVLGLRMAVHDHGPNDRGLSDELGHARTHLLRRAVDQVHGLRGEPDRCRDERHARHPIPVASDWQAVALGRRAVARRNGEVASRKSRVSLMFRGGTLALAVATRCRL